VIQQALALNAGPAAGTPAIYEQQRGHYNKVLKDFADAPGAVDAQFYLARVALDSGNALAAESAFKDFLSKHPNYSPFSLMAKLGIANALMAQEKWADAKAQYSLVSKDPQTAEAEFSGKRALYQSGMAALLAGDATAAEGILNDLRIDIEARETQLGEDRRYTTLKDDAEQLLSKIKIYTPEALREFVLAPIPEPEPPAPLPPTPAVIPPPTPGTVPAAPAALPRSEGPPKPAAGTPVPVTKNPATPEAATPAPAAPVTKDPATPEAATPPPAAPAPAAITPPVPTPKTATPPAAKSATPPAPAK
jgi:hypothetical protein